MVKASGLCAGKGVIICESVEEGHKAVDEMMNDKVFGASGDEVSPCFLFFFCVCVCACVCMKVFAFACPCSCECICLSIYDLVNVCLCLSMFL